MPREYRYIQQYAKEMLELMESGFTYTQTGDKLGFTKIKVKKFFERNRIKERNLSAGIAIKPKGRPRKDGTELPFIQQLSKLAQLQYELASKERYIKRLEMENELMRNFLLLTKRK